MRCRSAADAFRARAALGREIPENSEISPRVRQKCHKRRKRFCLRPFARWLSQAGRHLFDHLAQEIVPVGLLDAHAPPRVRRGPSVEQMLLLATLTRAVAAASTRRMASAPVSSTCRPQAS
jgi:hypothetical protein